MQHADLKIFIYLLVCCSPPFEFLPNRTLLRRIWLCVRRMLFWHANSINEGVKQTTASGRTDTQAAARATRACTPTRFNTLTRTPGDAEPGLWSRQARYCRPSDAVRRPPASGANKPYCDTMIPALRKFVKAQITLLPCKLRKKKKHSICVNRFENKIK